MDTLVMSVRCALLIVVTGVFAALWSGDVPDQVTVIERPSQFPSEQRDVHPKLPVKDYQSLEGETVDTTRSKGVPGSADRLSVPLPEDIVTGTYVVVDQSGRSETRVISVTDRAVGVAVRNHYAIEFGGSRWHFIRLDRTASILSTDSVVK